MRLDDVVATVCSIAQADAQRAGVVVRHAGWTGLEAWADSQVLERALLKVVDNAIRYNRPDGEVRLGVHGSGDRVWIDVIDTGRGIPDDVVNRLCTPFDRLGAEQRDEGAPGLGLAYARRVIDAMGGSLRLRATSPAGSVFTLEFRTGPSAAAPGWVGSDS